jgi:hypothetical protein
MGNHFISRWVNYTGSLVFSLSSIVFSAQLQADQNWIDGFILGAETDPGLQLPVAIKNHAGWIESVEGRWSADNSGDDENKFAIRLKPRSWQEYSAQASLLELTQQRSLLSSQQYLAELLEQRYQLLIDLNYHKQSQKILEQQAAVLSQENEAQLLMAQTEDFKPVRLQSIQLLLQRQQQQRTRTQNRLLAEVRQINTLNGTIFKAEDLLHEMQLISIKAIREQVFNREFELQTDLSTNMDIQFAELKQKMAEEKFNADSGKRGLAVSFIQLGLQPREGTKKSDTYEFRLGVQLPLGGDNLEKANRHYQKHEADIGLQRIRRVTEQKIQQQRDQINLLISEHESYQDRILKVASGRNSKRAQGGGILLLELNKEGLSLAKQRLDISREIYRRYITLLSLQGQLTRAPLNNWLRPL